MGTTYRKNRRTGGTFRTTSGPRRRTIHIGDVVRVVEGAGLSSGIEGPVISYQRYLDLGGDPNDFLLKVSPFDRLTFIEVTKSRYDPKQRAAVIHKSAVELIED